MPTPVVIKEHDTRRTLSHFFYIDVGLWHRGMRYNRLWLQRQFIVGFGRFMGFVDNQKNRLLSDLSCKCSSGISVSVWVKLNTFYKLPLHRHTIFPLGWLSSFWGNNNCNPFSSSRHTIQLVGECTHLCVKGGVSFRQEMFPGKVKKRLLKYNSQPATLGLCNTAKANTFLCHLDPLGWPTLIIQ